MPQIPFKKTLSPGEQIALERSFQHGLREIFCSAHHYHDMQKIPMCPEQIYERLPKDRREYFKALARNFNDIHQKVLDHLAPEEKEQLRADIRYYSTHYAGPARLKQREQKELKEEPDDFQKCIPEEQFFLLRFLSNHIDALYTLNEISLELAIITGQSIEAQKHDSN